MINPEQSINENIEAGQSPETAVREAVEEVVGGGEAREAVNPDAASSSNAKRWIKNFLSPEENWKDIKKYGKITAGGALIGGGGALFLSGKILWGLLKFAKKAIEKKGNITFKEGYEMGQDMFSFGDKKDKK